MSAAHATVDLDDTEGLLDADREGMLRASAMAGAQVRATAAAVEEGALESIAGGQRPRTVIWLAGRGPAVPGAAGLPGQRGLIAIEMGGNLEKHVATLEKIGFRDLGCREHVRQQPLEDVGCRGTTRRPRQPTVPS